MTGLLLRAPVNGRFRHALIKDSEMRTLLIAGSGLMLLAGACAPKVQIVAPDKPIEINLNIKIDQEVRVRLEKDVEDFIANNPDIF